MKYECNNCDFKTDDIEDLAYIKDLGARVDVGEFHPAGECPGCGFVVGCSDQDIIENTGLPVLITLLEAKGYTVVLGPAYQELLEALYIATAQVGDLANGLSVSELYEPPAETLARLNRLVPGNGVEPLDEQSPEVDESVEPTCAHAQRIAEAYGFALLQIEGGEWILADPLGGPDGYSLRGPLDGILKEFIEGHAVGFEGYGRVFEQTLNPPATENVK